MSAELADFLKDAMAEAEKYLPCMSLSVHEEGQAVELYLDTSVNTYSEWLDGEGADIGLIRDQKTKRVVGIRLPLLKNNLCVHHEGPIRINAGFKKGEAQ